MKKRLINSVLLAFLALTIMMPVTIRAAATEEEMETEQQNISGNQSLNFVPPEGVFEDIISKITYAIDPSGTRHFRNLLIKEQEDAEILSCERDRQGFTLTILKADTDDDEKLYHYKETVSFHIAGELPEEKTQEEMRDYFLKKYPDATAYYVFPFESDNKENKDCFYRVEENGITYAYFTYMGQNYEMTDEGCDSYYNCIDDMRSRLNFDYTIVCKWEKDENGDAWWNFIDHIFYLEKDIGTGEKFYFRITPSVDNDSAGESLPDAYEWDMDYVMEVSVYHEGNSEPFQVFLTSSDYYYRGGSMITFEDFNADGYLDICILSYYGANGGTAFHYLWSPSREQFIKCSDELDYFGYYWMDMDSRRLYMHWHESAVSGTEFIYQWENEMDCRLIKKFERDWAGDEIRFRVMDYPGEKERVLLDYADEAEASFSWDFYYDDLVWEKEISNSVSGEVYHLYYAQRDRITEDEDGEKGFEGYTDCLYVIDSQLQPVNYLEWESEAAYTEVIYTEQDSKGEGMFEASYTDGHKERYSFSEIMGEKTVKNR